MDKNDKIIEIDEFEVTNKKNNAQSEKDLTLISCLILMEYSGVRV